MCDKLDSQKSSSVTRNVRNMQVLIVNNELMGSLARGHVHDGLPRYAGQWSHSRDLSTFVNWYSNSHHGRQHPTWQSKLCTPWMRVMRPQSPPPLDRAKPVDLLELTYLFTKHISHQLSIIQLTLFEHYESCLACS